MRTIISLISSMLLMFALCLTCLAVGAAMPIAIALPIMIFINLLGGVTLSVIINWGAKEETGTGQRAEAK